VGHFRESDGRGNIGTGRQSNLSRSSAPYFREDDTDETGQKQLSVVVATAVILVEGASDRHAVASLATRRGRILEDEGVSVVAMGGATNIGKYLDIYGPRGLGLRLAGLCDAGEERIFRLALEGAGLGVDLDRRGLETLGFFVCEADLEDELIRTLGSDRVEKVIEDQGEMRAFRSFQNQPQWRGEPREDQLRRFMGTRAGRKKGYGRFLVDALDLDRVPPPLDGVLSSI
jgi:hypothetical protein